MIQMKPSNCLCDKCDEQDFSRIPACFCIQYCDNLNDCDYTECNKLSPETLNMVHTDIIREAYNKKNYRE